MTLDDYQRLAARTASGDDRRERAILGLNEEAGEVAAARKKYLRGDYSETEYLRRVASEIGDLFWYVAWVCTTHNLSLREVAEANIEKLADRAERGVIQGDGER